MKGYEVSLPIEKLHLSPMNPRIFTAENEEEALQELFLEQGRDNSSNKLLHLASDIAINGLHPTELIVVSPVHEGADGYTVREGNRRIAAIKCMRDPTIIPNVFPTLREKFSELDFDGIDAVRCYVSSDEEEIARLIETRHTGQNGGVGVIPWSSEQRSRFVSMRSGKPNISLEFSKSIIERFGANSPEAESLGKCKKTNLMRMLATPNVRDALGISFIDSQYSYDGFHDELLSAFLKKLATTPVNEIYYVGQRIDFINSLSNNSDCVSDLPDNNRQGSLFESESLQLKQENSTETHSESTNLKNNAAPRPKGYSFNRSTVIAQAGNSLSTEGKPAIGGLSNELKKLNAYDFPRAAALLLRSLIMITVDNYLKSLDSGQNLSNCREGEKINRACNELINDNSSGVGNNDIEYLRKFANNNDSSVPVTISSLHAVAHGNSGPPTAEAMIKFWDGIYKAIETMLRLSK